MQWNHGPSTTNLAFSFSAFLGNALAGTTTCFRLREISKLNTIGSLQGGKLRLTVEGACGGRRASWSFQCWLYSTRKTLRPHLPSPFILVFQFPCSCSNLWAFPSVFCKNNYLLFRMGSDLCPVQLILSKVSDLTTQRSLSVRHTDLPKHKSKETGFTLWFLT